MKTSFKFNQVINVAGQLALTEGHTDQSSSPRVSSCGLLSFSKGDIVKTQKYYTLVGLNTDHVWEIIFGDYDREVVKDEVRAWVDAGRDDSYPSLKIITTSDKQADIDLAVKRLNALEPDGYTLKEFNEKECEPRGLRLYKGEGYFYWEVLDIDFYGSATAESVYSCHFNQGNKASWIKELKGALKQLHAEY